MYGGAVNSHPSPAEKCDIPLSSMQNPERNAAATDQMGCFGGGCAFAISIPSELRVAGTHSAILL